MVQFAFCFFAVLSSNFPHSCEDFLPRGIEANHRRNSKAQDNVLPLPRFLAGEGRGEGILVAACVLRLKKINFQSDKEIRLFR